MLSNRHSMTRTIERSLERKAASRNGPGGRLRTERLDAYLLINGEGNDGQLDRYDGPGHIQDGGTVVRSRKRSPEGGNNGKRRQENG